MFIYLNIFLFLSACNGVGSRFHVTRGGISKANKVLCISEDIFGAFNSVLKGGRVIYREYLLRPQMILIVDRIAKS